MKDSASEMILADPIHAELRSAINIKKALDRIYVLKKLGYCPTKVLQFRDEFHLDNRDEDDDEERYATFRKSEKGIKNRDRTIQVCNSGSGV